MYTVGRWESLRGTSQTTHKFDNLEGTGGSEIKILGTQRSLNEL